MRSRTAGTSGKSVDKGMPGTGPPKRGEALHQTRKALVLSTSLEELQPPRTMILTRGMGRGGALDWTGIVYTMSSQS